MKMKIKEYKNELLGESVFCADHPSGLRVLVMPKEGYDSAYALFAVKYGSIDTFIGNEDGTYTPIPEGTAHFLEHKLFESEELDAFELFARTGAYSNAYTSFEQTAYLFKGSTNIDKSLEYLLDFVQSPYFTAETVQKEQGIIGQEIRMYQDDPGWVVMLNLLKCLYEKNPVRVDIAGTQESISHIDDKLLYKLYDTYYNPSNMVLCITGKANPDEIFAQVEKSIKREKKNVPQRKFDPEVPEAYQKYIEKKLPVGKKQFYLGFKEYMTKPQLTLEEEIASEILSEVLMGKSGHFFKRLLDEGLIEMDFFGMPFNGFGFSSFIACGISDNPERVAQLVKEEIARLKREGIPEVDIERARRKIYGRFIMDYNDIGSVSNCLMNMYFAGYEPFEELSAIRNVTKELVTQRLEKLTEEGSALSVVSPL